jgi:tRNA (guanine26-N2/guanine27-N2)-dimethyltransferase
MDLVRVVEGTTKFYVPDPEKYKLDSNMPVFFNSVMKLNRDITVQIVKNSFKKPKVLDLLAGTGAKGLRIANEIPSSKVDLNDGNPTAAKLIKKNAKLNKLEVDVFRDSANKLLKQSRRTYDFIDVDPFGTPIPFLEDSIKRLRKNGIIGVTATDTSALVGTYPSACMKKYGANNIKTKFMFEVGSRILIKKIVEEGIKQEISLEPIFTHSSNHYIRIYLKRVNKTLATIKKKVRPLFYCQNCTNFKISEVFTNSKKRCFCGAYFDQLGPLWIGKLWDRRLVEKLEGNKTIDLIKDESKLNVFGYFDYHAIAKRIKKKKDLPKMKNLIETIKKKGYNATRTHFSPTGIRSDIPPRTFSKLLTK